ncbi:MAG: triosephosphate isomerase [Frankiales bacterium]|jgi:triosephosphate isomerase|nr:triosephosphate isomerase [Frankiales bacterium]
MARKPLMAGNWKMNLNHLEAIAVVQKLSFSLSDKDFDAVECVVLPPFVDLRSVQTLVDGDKLRIGYGAQDLSPSDAGAHTGDVSGPMLAKLACQYVVIGHSERRTEHTESDELVRQKVLAAGRHGLVPILCVGEALEVRQSGQHVAHCVEQLRAALVDVPEVVLRTLVVAYEPIWAIGTGEVATPEDAQEVCAALRTLLAEVAGGDVADAIRVLYGGSVKSSNVVAIMAQPDVDGALVGGASLDAEEFAKIVRYPVLEEL